MMKRIAILIAVASFALSSSAACAGYRVDLWKATKKGRIYCLRTFDAKLLWHATFFSDGFRRVYDEKHIDINHLDAIQAARFVAEQQYRQSSGWDFFIGFYTKSEYKRFSSEPDSFWKIFLITESGERIEPSSVELLPITPYEEIMFPYLNRWSRDTG